MISYFMTKNSCLLYIEVHYKSHFLVKQKYNQNEKWIPYIFKKKWIVDWAFWIRIVIVFKSWIRIRIVLTIRNTPNLLRLLDPFGFALGKFIFDLGLHRISGLFISGIRPEIRFVCRISAWPYIRLEKTFYN